MSRALTQQPHLRRDSSRVYTWTDRYKYGFGRTRRERLVAALALVLDQHEVDQEQGCDALPLAEFLAGCLEARLHTREERS